MLMQVLENGLHVDPHDQHAIADALYKMLSEKQFWSRCREDGLKNIHQFSWSEHCKNYLSRISTLGPRHPSFVCKEDHKVPVKCRKHISVIAVDSVNKEDLIQIIRNSIEATRTGTVRFYRFCAVDFIDNSRATDSNSLHRHALD
jgi:sucrose-phosphate synthase